MYILTYIDKFNFIRNNAERDFMVIMPSFSRKKWCKVMLSFSIDWNKLQLSRLMVLLAVSIMIACGNMSFSDSSRTLEGRVEKARDSASADSETNMENSSDPQSMENSSLPDGEEEEITAEPPTIISGAYLACVPASDAENSLSCGVETELQTVDLSSFEAKFFWENHKQEQIILESILLEETNRYEVTFPENLKADTKNLGVKINIFGEYYSVYTKDFENLIPPDPLNGSDLGSGETPSNNDTDLAPKDDDGEEEAATGFLELPRLSTCSDVMNNPENEVVNITAFDTLPPLKKNTFLIITADGDDEVSLDLNGSEKIRGICIDANSNSMINLSVQTHVNQVVIFSNSNGVLNLNFSGKRIFNQIYGESDSNGVINISGQAIDCDKVDVLKKSNAVVSCGNPDD